MARKPTSPKKSTTAAKRTATAAEKLERAKLAALKELAYGASHEINNPLANIVTRAQTLLRLETDPEKRRMLAAIHAQALRAHEMIADLMLFARPPQLAKERFNLIPWLTEILEAARAEAAERELAASFELDLAGCDQSQSPALEMAADPVQLAVAVRAVLRNSLEALEHTGTVRVAVTQTENQVRIDVTDTGRGIPAEVLPHVFEPFYSGREAGRGLGFGLAKAWRIITDHGGQIAFTDTSPGQTKLEITLPT